MKSLLFTSLLLFILFISVNAICDQGSSYSECQNKGGSDCCFIDIVYYCKTEVGRPEHPITKCAISSKISSFDDIVNDENCKGEIKKRIIQCSSNSSNFLIFDLLALILLLYISDF